MRSARITLMTACSEYRARQGFDGLLRNVKHQAMLNLPLPRPHAEQSTFRTFVVEPKNNLALIEHRSCIVAGCWQVGVDQRHHELYPKLG